MYRLRERVQISFPGIGKTHQEFKKECDVNTIVRQWRKSHVVTHLNQNEPFYGDFTDGEDYLGSVLKIQKANDAFLGLPSSVRDLCGNSPAKFMAMAENEKDLARLVDAGLAVKTPEAPQARADKVIQVSPSPAAVAPEQAGSAAPATPSEGSKGSAPGGA